MFKTLPWASLHYFEAPSQMCLPFPEPPWRPLFSFCRSCKQGGFSPQTGLFFGTAAATNFTQQLF